MARRRRPVRMRHHAVALVVLGQGVHIAVPEGGHTMEATSVVIMEGKSLPSYIDEALVAFKHCSAPFLKSNRLYIAC